MGIYVHHIDGSLNLLPLIDLSHVVEDVWVVYHASHIALEIYHIYFIEAHKGHKQSHICFSQLVPYQITTPRQQLVDPVQMGIQRVHCVIVGDL